MYFYTAYYSLSKAVTTFRTHSFPTGQAKREKCPIMSLPQAVHKVTDVKTTYHNSKNNSRLSTRKQPRIVSL